VAGALAANSAFPSQQQSSAAFQRPVSTPLSHLISDEQAQQVAPQVPAGAIENVRQQFEQEAGVAELDPADPEYQHRWETAEPTAADRMRSLYGWAAYSEFQRQAALAAQQP
jgi:hypothetical protein